VNYQRIVERPFFGLEYLRDRLGVKRVRSEPINSLCGERDKPALSYYRGGFTDKIGVYIVRIYNYVTGDG
jgi:hypothetical protein